VTGVPLPDHVEAIAKKVNNWGRWGSDDQLGTLNFIDEAARLRGVKSVRTGRAFALGLPLDENGPQMGFVKGRDNPVHTMVMINEPSQPGSTGCWSDDAITMGVQACTHWDALSHASLDGQLYNGHPASAITSEGAALCGIDVIPTIVSRGILLDVARARGVDQLPGGYAIGPEDLDAALALAGLNIEPGDIILLRTGHMKVFLSGDKLNYAVTAPGPGIHAAEWMHRHSVAALALDNLIFEVFPCESKDAWLPVHFLHLVHMGMIQGQNWNLEELAADCASDGQYDFLLNASPEPITRGTGSMVNPVAVK